MAMERTSMREQLVGYLFGALDDAESMQVEMSLADPRTGPALRRDLDALRLAVKPLERDREPSLPPPGLAGCRARHRRACPEPPGLRSRWARAPAPGRTSPPGPDGPQPRRAGGPG